MNRVVAQHLLDGSKFLCPLLLNLLLAQGVLLFFSRSVDADFLGRIHKSGSSGLLKENGEGLARAVEFAPNGVGRLVGQGGDLVVAHLLIGHEQQEQAIFVR
jgi:hypothetical protein